MLGLAKTCMKLKLSFYEFLGDRLGIPGAQIPHLAEPLLSVPPRHNRHRKGTGAGNLPRLLRTVTGANFRASGEFKGSKI